MSHPPYCFKCKVQNSELLAFYRHDLIILNNFLKIWWTKNQKPEEIDHKLRGNYVKENNFVSHSLSKKKFFIIMEIALSRGPVPDP